MECKRANSYLIIPTNYFLLFNYVIIYTNWLQYSLFTDDIISCSISIGKSGLSFQAPPSYSSKPLPHERILQRSRTVAVGLGSSNKLSKKAMLLKWCQFITQDYDVSAWYCVNYCWSGKALLPECMLIVWRCMCML